MKINYYKYIIYLAIHCVHLLFLIYLKQQTKKAIHSQEQKYN